MNLWADADLFAQATLSIVMEAVPFLLLGAVASGLVEAYVPREKLERLLPRGRLAGTLFGLGLGAVTPCCECGVVYLARRLLAKGMAPGAAVAFMLAAPVVNPVSVAATVIAFRGDLTMAVWRCLIVAVAALAVGYWAGGQEAERLLKPLTGRTPDGCGCDHDHGHAAPAISRPETAMRHAMADFLDMAKVLILGSMVAAAFKSFVPTPVVVAMEDHPTLAVVGLMALAVILSLCSQADAFVAASFSSFSQAARLAFLALGPMLDIKLMLMWRQVFTRRLVRVLTFGPAAIVLVVCLSLTLLWAGGGA